MTSFEYYMNTPHVELLEIADELSERNKRHRR
nr:MAG TPA: hypothetical protein [Caudoviricetes sp.]